MCKIINNFLVELSMFYANRLMNVASTSKAAFSFYHSLRISRSFGVNLAGINRRSTSYWSSISMSEAARENTNRRHQPIKKALPEIIEKDCQSWEHVLEAEIEASRNKHSWFSCNLQCTDVSYSSLDKTTKMFLSTTNLAFEHKRVMVNKLGLGTSVELCESIQLELDGEPAMGSNPLLGVVQARDNRGILLKMKDNLSEQELKVFMGKFMKLRKWALKSRMGELNFLKSRAEEWHRLPGYATMLQTYQGTLPKEPAVHSDPSIAGLIDENNQNFDQSQQEALAAALNPNRPIVAIHGPAGTGKSRLLVECMRVYAQQNKRIVLRCALRQMYALIQQYHELSGRTDFVFLTGLDRELIDTFVREPAMRELIAQKTVVPNIGSVGRVQRDNAIRIVCSDGSYSLLIACARVGFSFDFLLIDDANRTEEMQTWQNVLVLSPRLRLFGDYKSLRSPLKTGMARDAQLGTSLLQRLDEKFGAEVNFWLRRQYRSNPAIQLWSNRVFYKDRAAEAANDSVKALRLEDVLGEKKKKSSSSTSSLITDPLVLVDTGQLEGEWRAHMFQAVYVSFGEALLVAMHLANLIQHGMRHDQVAYANKFDAQHVLVRAMLDVIFSQQKSSSDVHNWRILMGRSIHSLVGQQPEVVVKSRSSGALLFPSPCDWQFELTQWNFEFTRARRQFMLIENGELLCQGTPEMRALHECFRTQGRIVGPNELAKLKPGQFERIKATIEQRYLKRLRRRTSSDSEEEQ